MLSYQYSSSFECKHNMVIGQFVLYVIWSFTSENPLDMTSISVLNSTSVVVRVGCFTFLWFSCFLLFVGLVFSNSLCCVFCLLIVFFLFTSFCSAPWLFAPASRLFPLYTSLVFSLRRGWYVCCLFTHVPDLAFLSYHPSLFLEFLLSFIVCFFCCFFLI